MFCSKKKPLPSCPNIITPDQIPKFFIPPKLPPMPGRGVSNGFLWLDKRNSNAGSQSIQRALLRSANHHVIQVEDMEQEMETSELPLHPSFPATIIRSAYLAESPHTRRRESLFHEICPTQASCEETSLSSVDPDYMLSWRTSSPDLGLRKDPSSPKHHGGTMDSDTTSSAESSPFNSPLLTRTMAGTQFCQAYSKQRLFCRTLSVKTLARANSLSTEETSSTDTSPSVPRRESKSHGLGVSMICLAPPPVFHLDFICCQERLTKATEVMLSKGGLLRLSAEYMKEVGRLRVRLVSAESLYNPQQDPKSISCCVTMCLQPGKLQKQRSTVIKKSRNPIFNEDFFFEGMEKRELDVHSLKVKVINRGSSMRRDQELGHSELTLSSIIPP
ncbi:C2 calcium-dependent domain-containing protein 4C-like isoform X2 [Ascaphus truei]|uniref:C2 calcium-dependent domain-containing protein 4C-like isoform X2 n=1 Tax=Ascaphus truei TaxID=8439 RepID=UPI003F5AB305